MSVVTLMRAARRGGDFEGSTSRGQSLVWTSFVVWNCFYKALRHKAMQRSMGEQGKEEGMSEKGLSKPVV